MRIKIIENNKRYLYVYIDNELFYYSTFKHNFINKTIKIFNKENELILQVKIGGLFLSSTFQIQHKAENATIIQGINEDNIYLDKNRNLIKKYNNRFISLSWKYSYFFKGEKIAEIKQNLWKDPLKRILVINDQNLEFLDSIIIHILSTETCND